MSSLITLSQTPSLCLPHTHKTHTDKQTSSRARGYGVPAPAERSRTEAGTENVLDGTNYSGGICICRAFSIRTSFLGFFMELLVSFQDRNIDFKFSRSVKI